jgi:hypothetical protein
VLEAAHEGLDVEHLTHQTELDRPGEGQEVGVPPAALVHGEDAVVGRRGRHHAVGVGEREAHRLLDHHVLAGVQQGHGELGMMGRRRGDDRDVDRVVGAQLHRRGIGPQPREVVRGRNPPLGDGVDGRDEGQSVGLGRGEAVGVAHPPVRPVAHDTDPEGARRGGRRTDQATHEPPEHLVGEQRCEVADPGAHHPAGAEGPHGQHRHVPERDARGRHHLDAVTDGPQHMQRRGDRHLTVEPGGLRDVTEGHEPLGARQMRLDVDTGQRRAGRITGLGHDEQRTAGLDVAAQLVDGRRVALVEPTHDHPHTGPAARRLEKVGNTGVTRT